MDTQTIVIAALVLVMGWFAAGTLYNLRRGNAILRWIQGGLPLIGEKTTFRWLGTSVAQMQLANPKRPFRHADLMIVLAPRDVPWFWVLAAASGRRDVFIFRSQLAGSPQIDFELAHPTSWTGKPALKEAAKKGWVSEPYRDLQLSAPAGSIARAREFLPQLEASLAELGSTLTRLAVHTEKNKLELHLPLPDPRTQDARNYFRSLTAVAAAVTKR